LAVVASTWTSNHVYANISLSLARARAFSLSLSVVAPPHVRVCTRRATTRSRLHVCLRVFYVSEKVCVRERVAGGLMMTAVFFITKKGLRTLALDSSS
jgi:hypothetical protein